MLEERQQQHEERRRFEKLQGEVFGVSISQARDAARTALRVSSDARALQRREERALSPAIAPAAPRIIFSEAIQQPRVVQYFAENTPEGQPFPQSTGSGTGPALPSAEGKYDLSIDSGGAATWTFDTVPNAPLMVDGRYALSVAGGVATWEASELPALPETDGTFVLLVNSLVGTWQERHLPPDVPAAIPGEDCYYALRRNSSGDPEWFKMFNADVPDCSSGSPTTFEVFTKTDPGP